MHGASPKMHWVPESRRVWIPIAIIIFAGWLGTWGWAMLLVYPLQIVRLALQGARSARGNWWRALFLVMG